MTLEPLTCSNCGSALDVPPNVQFVTCAYCGTRLAVRRTGSAAYTEVLERLDQRTELMAGNIEAIRLQNELERVDREWQMEREQWMVRNKDGTVSPPSPIAPLAAVAIATFGFFMIVGVGGIGTAPPVVFMGLLMIGLAVAGAISAFVRSARYSEAEAAYRQQRAELVRQLDENRLLQEQGTE